MTAHDEVVADCSTCEKPHTYIERHSLGMLCARCQQHTGNNHQGHFWGLCKVLLASGVSFDRAIREPHFCCPDSCELEVQP